MEETVQKQTLQRLLDELREKETQFAQLSAELLTFSTEEQKLSLELKYLRQRQDEKNKEYYSLEKSINNIRSLFIEHFTEL